MFVIPLKPFVFSSFRAFVIRIYVVIQVDQLILSQQAPVLVGQRVLVKFLKGAATASTAATPG